MAGNRRMDLCRCALLLAAVCAPLIGQSVGKGMIVILIGAPGSGKTTQAEFLKKKYQLQVISAVDVIRKNHKKAFKGELAGQMKAGSLISDDALNNMMRDAIVKSDHVKGFILDGYPSSKVQADFLSGIAKEKELLPPTTVVLDIPDDISRKRLLERKSSEDTPQQIDRRLAEFHREWDAIKPAYPSVRIFNVDGTKSRSEVSNAIAAALDGVR